MNKGKGSINEYKGGANSVAVDTRPAKGDLAATQNTVSESALAHASLGEYNTENRPKSGGHGQESIEYMKERGIPIDIKEEYNNGVRAGNIPTHKNVMFHSGNKHTWFPESWTRQDIKLAGEYVSSQYTGQRTPGSRHTAIYNGVSVTVIFGEHGKIATIFPSADQPGGKKK